jgi:6,7-dimethyl-8-ribityllumazine synthase
VSIRILSEYAVRLGGMSRNKPKAKKHAVGGGVRIAVIASRFNQDLVDELLRRCLDRLLEIGLKKSAIAVHRVPGAFELPLAAKIAATSKKFDAIICLGAVVRGDTPHFDFVASEAARGIQDVALETKIPVIFGVLTTNDQKQAKDRLDAGTRAAEAAIEMIEFAKSI